MSLMFEKIRENLRDLNERIEEGYRYARDTISKQFECLLPSENFDFSEKNECAFVMPSHAKINPKLKKYGIYRKGQKVVLNKKHEGLNGETVIGRLFNKYNI